VAEFAIAYGRSGGLKSMPQKLVIRPGRHAVLTTLGPELGSLLRTVRFRVAAKKIEGLRDALERAGFQTIGIPGPSPGVCADCFFYEIEYRGHMVSFSQAQMPGRLRGVVSRIEALIATHLPFH
jgi:hypothetical protein